MTSQLLLNATRPIRFALAWRRPTEADPIPQTIKVGIADDHGITRRALRDFIAQQPGLVVCGEARDGQGAVEMARREQPDVLVLDLLMPHQSGLDVMQMLRARAPHTRILVLTGCPESHYALDFFRRGALGFLSKECDPEQIIGAIRTVASGRRYITPEVAELMGGVLGGECQPRKPHELLTSREFQLLIQYARSGRTADIAANLFLSPRTVSTYRTSLLAKMGLKSNADATHYCMVHGLMD